MTVEHASNQSTELIQEPTIEELREEIDQADVDIIAAIHRRTELSRKIGQQRIAEGGTRLVISRENEIYERYQSLGKYGVTLATILLELGRGRLGR